MVGFRFDYSCPPRVTHNHDIFIDGKFRSFNDLAKCMKELFRYKQELEVRCDENGFITEVSTPFFHPFDKTLYVNTDLLKIPYNETEVKEYNSKRRPIKLHYEIIKQKYLYNPDKANILYKNGIEVGAVKEKFKNNDRAINGFAHYLQSGIDEKRDDYVQFKNVDDLYELFIRE